MKNPFDRDHDTDSGPDLGTQGTEHKASGAMDKVAGKAEEVAGDLTGNEKWQAEGKAKEMKGSVKQGLGTAEDRVDQAAEDLTS